MIWNPVSILFALSAFGVLVASSDRSVDCRKFVFAPLCRGVAAKRMSAEGERSSSPVYLANKSFRDFLKNIYLDVELAGSNENEKESNFLRKIYLRLMNENFNKRFQESERIKN